MPLFHLQLKEVNYLEVQLNLSKSRHNSGRFRLFLLCKHIRADKDA